MSKILIDRAAPPTKQQQLEQMRLESRQQVANLFWQVPAQDMHSEHAVMPATITREDRVKYASTKKSTMPLSPRSVKEPSLDTLPNLMRYFYQFLKLRLHYW